MTAKACVSVRSQTEIGFCGTVFSPQRGLFKTVTHAVCPLMEGHCVTALPPEQINCGQGLLRPEHHSLVKAGETSAWVWMLILLGSSSSWVIT